MDERRDNSDSMEYNLPHIIDQSPHREFDSFDLHVIFQGAGSWWLFFALVVCSGIRIDNAAMLIQGSIDRQRRIIGTNSPRSGRYYELLFLPALLDHIPLATSLAKPIFPSLYADIEDPIIWEEQINENLAQPSDYLKALLSAQGRPIASLMALRMTFNKSVKPLLSDPEKAGTWFAQNCRPLDRNRVVS